MPLPRYAVDFVTQGFLKYVDTNNIKAIEFGNEPDHWQLVKKCFRSDPDYQFSSFMDEYLKLEKDLTKAWPAKKALVPFQGPAIAGCNTFAKGTIPCWQVESTIMHIHGIQLLFIILFRFWLITDPRKPNYREIYHPSPTSPEEIQNIFHTTVTGILVVANATASVLFLPILSQATKPSHMTGLKKNCAI